MSNTVISARPDPPALIGGSEPSRQRISACVDWISLTIPKGVPQPKSPYLAALVNEYEDTGGLHGYNRGRKYTDGRIMLDNPNRPEMGVHWVFSGSTLNELNERGLSPYHVLKIYRTGGAKITRLDVALDCHETALEMAEIERLIDAGLFDAKSRKFSRVTGIGDTPGHTIYIGSRQSEMYGRFYDKAAERKQEGKWIRLELELKQGRANYVCDQIVSGGLAWLPRHLPGLIRGLIDFPEYPSWTEVLKSERIIVGKSNKQNTNTRQWLLTTVAGVIGRLLARDGNDSFWFELRDRVFAVKKDYEERMSVDRDSNDPGELPRE